MHGILLGLGLSFMTQGIVMMRATPWLVVAAFAMWNMGAAFLAGILLYQALQRGWVRL